MAGEHTYAEIYRHPQAFAAALKAVRPLPALPEGGEYLFASAGIMLYVAEGLARLADMLGFPARAVPSQDLFLYRNSLCQRPRVCVVLSRTGDVSDNGRAIEAARQDSVASRFFAIIGEQGGPLAALVDDKLECDVAEESVATTGTLSAMVLAGVAATFATVGLTMPKLRTLPEMAEKLLPQWDTQARHLAEQGLEQLVFLGTGPAYGLAKAAALSAFEMSLLHSAGYHTLVYPHGHKVNLSSTSLVTLFLSDSGRRDELQALDEVRRLGARTAVIGKNVADVSADVTLELGGALSENERLPLLPMFGQLLGYHCAMRSGYNPDQPPQLKKVF